jgi:dihydroneopterin aldolase
MSDIGRSERRLVDERRVARPTDTIEIRGLRVHGHHGVHEHEQVTGQPFLLDVALDVDTQIAARTDSLADTVDYGMLVARVADLVRSTRFNLVEALGAHIADDLLTMRRVAAVRVCIIKPEVDFGEEVDAVAVTVFRVRPVHIR